MHSGVINYIITRLFDHLLCAREVQNREFAMVPAWAGKWKKMWQKMRTWHNYWTVPWASQISVLCAISLGWINPFWGGASVFMRKIHPPPWYIDISSCMVLLMEPSINYIISPLFDHLLWPREISNHDGFGVSWLMEKSLEKSGNVA